MSLCIMYCTVAAAKTGNVLTQITPTQRKIKKKKYSTQPNSQSTISVARKILQNFERAPIYIPFLLCRIQSLLLVLVQYKRVQKLIFYQQ